MMLCIADVLTREELARLQSALTAGEFVDGSETTGFLGKRVKNNRQLPRKGAASRALAPVIEGALLRSRMFDWAVWPKRIGAVQFSRYDAGMQYGAHVDNAIMGRPDPRWNDGASSGPFRSDVAFTVFLSDPTDYDGGELVIESPVGPQEIKLAAGEAVVYPASTLHRVAEVTRGQRFVAVGWVQSFIRDPAQREILFDLECTMRFLQTQLPDAPETMRLFKTQSNILRMWAEP